MAVTLGGVSLPDDLVWVNRDAYNPVRQEVKFTLGGAPVMYHRSISSARPIVLASLPDQAWFTKAQVDSITGLADVAAATYALVIGSDSFSVVFDYTQGQAAEFNPLIGRSEPLAGDYFTGTLKFLTV